MGSRAVRPVAITFILEIPVDLGLDPGLSVPPTGGSIRGSARTRIFLARRPERSILNVRDVLQPLQDFFAGVTFALDSRVDWPSLTRSSTVAAVTVLHPTRAARFRPTDRWMTLRFEEALRALDRVLSCIGFLSGAPDVGPVRRTDLPSSVLVAVDDAVRENREPRQVLLTEMQLHSFEEWTDALVNRTNLLETAMWLADRLDGAGAPFRLFVDYSQRSRRDLLDGATAQSVIAATVAAETLVAGTLRAIWGAAGADDALIRRRMQAGFQNLLRDHIRRYLQSVSMDDGIVSAWIDDCYRLRNRVIHEGFVPDHQASLCALDQTTSLGVVLAEALRKDPRTHGLGESIPLRAQTPEERGRAHLTRLIDGTSRLSP